MLERKDIRIKFYMTKISFTGKQHTITIPKELVKMMGFKKGTEVIISKYPDKNILFIEEIKKNHD